MTTNFKPAQDADLDRLIVFMREFYAHEHLAFDESAARRALQKILRDHDLGHVWLIQDGEQPVGYVVLTFGYSLEFRGRDALVDELYIRASHRGQGAGAQTLKFVEEACRAFGVDALHLEVERANTKAQAFYHKAGFKDHDRYLLTKWIAKN